MNIQELGGMKLPELKAAAKQLKIKGVLRYGRKIAAYKQTCAGRC